MDRIDRLLAAGETRLQENLHPDPYLSEFLEEMITFLLHSCLLMDAFTVQNLVVQVLPS